MLTFTIYKETKKKEENEHGQISRENTVILSSQGAEKLMVGGGYIGNEENSERTLWKASVRSVIGDAGTL